MIHLFRYVKKWFWILNTEQCCIFDSWCDQSCVKAATGLILLMQFNLKNPLIGPDITQDIELYCQSFHQIMVDKLKLISVPSV